MKNKSILELHDMLINNNINVQELVRESNEYAKIANKQCNLFVTQIDSPVIYNVTNNLLSGIPYGAKDNISTKEILTTGSSNSLKDYIPIFNATVINKLNENNAVLTNKTALDEFAMGGTGTTCHTGPVKNPWDLERICGGSSSGSAAAVACGVYPFALGTDTGDSIRKPASYCGVVGYKPTYGMVSRYGVFPFASSLDHVGCITRNVKDAAIVIDAIKGIDKNDLTSWDSSNIHLYDSIEDNLKGKRLFYIKEYFTDNIINSSEEIRENINNFNKSLEILKNEGATVDEISMDINILKAISSVYHCISFAESTSNLSNLTSIPFGKRGNGNTYEEIIKDYRTKGFSPLIKRRLVIGSYILQKENQEKYFVSALRARRLIVNMMKELFKEYDALIMPTTSGIAPKFNELSTLTETILDNHLQIGNFGGFPSITIPNGFVSNMPTGITITGNCYDDIKVLNIAYSLEQNMPYKNQIIDLSEVHNG